MKSIPSQARNRLSQRRTDSRALESSSIEPSENKTLEEYRDKSTDVFSQKNIRSFPLTKPHTSPDLTTSVLLDFNSIFDSKCPPLEMTRVEAFVSDSSF